jgi:hypothetical protein
MNSVKKALEGYAMSNQSVQTKSDNISVSLLNFDPENPRIPNDIDGSNDDEVIEYLLTEANLDDLMKSLVSQGYFEGEPLLVCPTDNGKYIVVEGNRRLGALKLINGYPPPRKEGTVNAILMDSKGPIETVPCIIFPKRGEILSYLGYRHITGIKEWDHLAKARYLKQLYSKTVSDIQSNNLSPKEIYKILAKNIGSKSNVVENLLRGLMVLEFADNNDILNKIDKKPDDIYFSLLTTSLNNNKIKEYIGLDETGSLESNNLNREATENLLSWLYGDRNKGRIIGESRDIQKLAKVIGNESSLRYLIDHQNDKNILETSYFLSGGLLDGFEESISKIENFVSSLLELLPRVSNDLNRSHVDRLEIMSKNVRSLYVSAKDIYETDEE